VAVNVSEKWSVLVGGQGDPGVSGSVTHVHFVAGARLSVCNQSDCTARRDRDVDPDPTLTVLC